MTGMNGSSVGGADRPRAHRLRPVIEFMERNAGAPLSPHTLARAGYMSVRTLHTTFHNELGTSAMAYLRAIRLDGVRSELLRVGPRRRVTEVAMRWGFSHPSRFAQQYRDRFGELPSQTLRRLAQPGRAPHCADRTRAAGHPTVGSARHTDEGGLR
jgi:transcriptional regulator GlxA family with amidase domain